MAIEPTVLRAWTEVLEDYSWSAVILVGGIASGSRDTVFEFARATRMFGYERSELDGSFE
jgi:hypothetical protein